MASVLPMMRILDIRGSRSSQPTPLRNFLRRRGGLFFSRKELLERNIITALLGRFFKVYGIYGFQLRRNVSSWQCLQIGVGPASRWNLLGLPWRSCWRKAKLLLWSRMRSEGFPFIVGVWGWTCVRVAFVVSSSPRRRRRRLVVANVVANSLIRCHWAVHSHCDTHPYFQSMKSGGSLARNARFGAPKSQNVRSFSCFAWQAQYFGSVSMQARRFFVAGAALCDVAFRDVVAGAAFCDVAKVLFPRIALAVTCKRDTTANIVAGAGFGDCLEKWRKLRKSHTFWAL